jgi:serine/threonine protein kinase
MRIFDNKYQYVQDLGGGGFGIVYLAKENISGELRAIKKLKNTESDQAEIIHEIQQVAKLKLPNTVTYHHHFWEKDELHFVMEYCSKGNFHDILAKDSPRPEQLFEWIKEIALSLNEIHRQQIVHKDIKPLNILFSESGRPKISDFGLANRFGGTKSYMSPGALMGQKNSNIDPREDIYSLGVTLMEVLTGINPFRGKDLPEIMALHQKQDFPISDLPDWQQQIILKAIHFTPELRFQNMEEFAEAITARQVPFVFRKEILDAGIISSKIKNLIKFKKWGQAGHLVEYGLKKYPENLNIIEVSGSFFISRGKGSSAKNAFEKALTINPRINIQKELGEVQLELKNFPQAISLISDHLHRNPNDLDAQNLLLKCFYLTERFEAGMSLANELLKIFPKTPFLTNNHFICETLLGLRTKKHQKKDYSGTQNPFLEYNLNVLNEPDSIKSHNGNTKPALKSKLLFMETRFKNLEFKKTQGSEIIVLDSNIPGLVNKTFLTSIIKIGRDGFYCNEILIPGGNNISRRHAVIINQKNDCWIYDLDSYSGTLVNGEQVNGKMPLVGVSKICIGDFWMLVTNDRERLI